jgi:hypothetical protein
MHRRAEDDAALLLSGLAPEGDEVRALLAGARLAYEQDPRRFTELDLQTPILGFLPAEGGVRRDEGQRSPREMQDLEASDRAAGAELFRAAEQWRQESGWEPD